MVTNSKAVKEAEQLRISQIGDFKNRLGGTMELPSGFVVKARNPGGLRAFMSSGNIPNSLMTIIQSSLSKGKAPKPEEILGKSGKLDPKMLEEMNELLDNITMQTIVEPKIHPRPLAEEDRSDEMLYIDEIPDDDKQFLFQWISGGTRDLERFRQQRDSSLDAMAAVAGNGAGSESSNGADAG